ncbi:MAG: DUF29 domain-containing protein [Pseudomonadota bacterium]
MQTVSYDEDYHAWARQNAELIRQGRLSEVDVEHVAEELDNMGKSQKRELVSRLSVLLAHLLKWQYQPDRRSGSWVGTIVTQRAEIVLLLDESPSLMHDIHASIGKGYKIARERAAGETGIPANAFPESCPYTLDEMVTEEFRTAE